MPKPYEELCRPEILSIHPYTPGKPLDQVMAELGLAEILQLANNENVLGPSPKAVAAMALAAGDYWLYPDLSHHRLKAALSAHLGIGADHLVIGAGSTAIIRLIGETFFRPGDEVVYAWPGFIMYDWACRLMGAKQVAVPLDGDMRHDLDRMAAAITDRTRLVFVCNPNNPTGTYNTRAEIERFLDQVPADVIVVLDEAYFEFARRMTDYPDGIDYVRQGRRVLVLRSFSKIYGLAGLRVGYGIGAPELVGLLRRTREPFHVTSPAQEAAIAALGDSEHVQASVAAAVESCAILAAASAKLGLKMVPSVANFAMIDAGRDTVPLAAAMLQQGVMIRPANIFGLPTWMRITVGTPAQTQRFVEVLQSALAE